MNTADTTDDEGDDRVAQPLGTMESVSAPAAAPVVAPVEEVSRRVRRVRHKSSVSASGAGGATPGAGVHGAQHEAGPSHAANNTTDAMDVDPRPIDSTKLQNVVRQFRAVINHLQPRSLELPPSVVDTLNDLKLSVIVLESETDMRSDMRSHVKRLGGVIGRAVLSVMKVEDKTLAKQLQTDLTALGGVVYDLQD